MDTEKQIIACCKKQRRPWYREEEDDDTNARIRALALYLQINPDDIEPAKYGENLFEVGIGKRPDQYLVVTDNEADDLWDQELDRYIDDCLELPDHLEAYFDRDKWKRDARVDGRAHSLGYYDGNEGFETDPWDNTEYYIYRQN